MGQLNYLAVHSAPPSWLGSHPPQAAWWPKPPHARREMFAAAAEMSVLLAAQQRQQPKPHHGRPEGAGRQKWDGRTLCKEGYRRDVSHLHLCAFHAQLLQLQSLLLLQQADFVGCLALCCSQLVGQLVQLLLCCCQAILHEWQSIR